MKAKIKLIILVSISLAAIQSQAGLFKFIERATGGAVDIDKAVDRATGGKVDLEKAADRATGGAFKDWKPLVKPLDPIKKGAENVTNELDKYTGGVAGVLTKPLEIADGWFDGWKPFRKPLTPAEKAFEDASKTFTTAAEWAKFFVENLLIDRDWPDGFPKQKITRLVNPSCEVGVGLEAVNSALALYKDERLPLESGDDHVILGDLKIDYDSNRDVFLINIRGGKVRYEFLFDNSFHVRSIDLEAIPRPRTVDGKFFVDLLVVCTRFDIAECPGEVDRLVAHALNKGIEKSGGVVASIDLTKSLAVSINMGTHSKAKATATVTEPVCFLENRNLRVQARVAFKK